MGKIYHIAYEVDWLEARRDGFYRVSTRGRTLAEQGFIHAGRAHQVAQVANAVYSGQTGLVVLVIDEDRVTSRMVDEPPPGSAELFPHIYGPLNVDAVVATRRLGTDSDGRFTFTDG